MNEMKGSREQEIESNRKVTRRSLRPTAHDDFEFKWHKMDENRYLQKRNYFSVTF